MRCIVEGKIFDTERAEKILTRRDLQNEYEYYKTVKGNFVVVQKPAPEVEAVSYVPSCTAAVVSEGLMRSILGMYDLNKYEEIFGVEELDIL